LDEADQLATNREDMSKKMGAADADKFRGLVAASVDHSQRNLFAYDPAMSNPPDAWVKSDPTFWGKK
jgi:hypothetical protein